MSVKAGNIHYDVQLRREEVQRVLQETERLGRRLSELLDIDAGAGGEALEGISQGARRATREIDPLSEQVGSVRNEILGLRSAYIAGQINQEEFTEQMTRLKGEALDLSQNFDRTSIEFRQLNVAAATAERGLSSVRGEASRLGLASQVNISLTSSLRQSLTSLGPAGRAASLGLAAAGDQTTRLNSLIGVGLSAAVLIGTAALWRAASAAADYAAEIDTASQKTGLAIDTIQELRFAADVLEVPFSALERSVTALTNRLDGTEEGADRAQRGLQALGLSARDANGQLRSMDDLFPSVIQRLSEMENETQRNALAQDILGRGAADLIPILNAGGEELERLTSRARELPGFLDREGIDSLLQFREQVTELRFSFQGLFRELAVDGVPILTEQVVPIIRDDLLPVIRNLFGFIGDLLERFQALNPEMREAVFRFTAVTAVVWPLVSAVSALTTALGVAAGPKGWILLAVGGLAQLAANSAFARDEMQELSEAASQAQEAIQFAEDVGELNRELDNLGNRLTGSTKQAWQEFREELNENINSLDDMRAAITQTEGAIASFFAQFQTGNIEAQRSILEARRGQLRDELQQVNAILSAENQRENIQAEIVRLQKEAAEAEDTAHRQSINQRIQAALQLQRALEGGESLTEAILERMKVRQRTLIGNIDTINRELDELEGRTVDIIDVPLLDVGSISRDAERATTAVTSTMAAAGRTIQDVLDDFEAGLNAATLRAELFGGTLQEQLEAAQMHSRLASRALDELIRMDATQNVPRELMEAFVAETRLAEAAVSDLEEQIGEMLTEVTQLTDRDRAILAALFPERTQEGRMTEAQEKRRMKQREQDAERLRAVEDQLSRSRTRSQEEASVDIALQGERRQAFNAVHQEFRRGQAILGQLTDATTTHYDEASVDTALARERTEAYNEQQAEFRQTQFLLGLLTDATTVHQDEVEAEALTISDSRRAYRERNEEYRRGIALVEAQQAATLAEIRQQNELRRTLRVTNEELEETQRARFATVLALQEQFQRLTDERSPLERLRDDLEFLARGSDQAASRAARALEVVEAALADIEESEARDEIARIGDELSRLEGTAPTQFEILRARVLEFAAAARLTADEIAELEARIDELEASAARQEGLRRIATIAAGVGRAFNDLSTLIEGRLSQALSGLGSLAQGVGNVIRQWSTDVVSNVVNVVSTAIQWIVGLFTRARREAERARREAERLERDAEQRRQELSGTIVDTAITARDRDLDIERERLELARERGEITDAEFQREMAAIDLREEQLAAERRRLELEDQRRRALDLAEDEAQIQVINDLFDERLAQEEEYIDLIRERQKAQEAAREAERVAAAVDAEVDARARIIEAAFQRELSALDGNLAAQNRLREQYLQEQFELELQRLDIEEERLIAAAQSEEEIAAIRARFRAERELAERELNDEIDRIERERADRITDAELRAREAALDAAFRQELQLVEGNLEEELALRERFADRRLELELEQLAVEQERAEQAAQSEEELAAIREFYAIQRLELEREINEEILDLERRIIDEQERRADEIGRTFRGAFSAESAGEFAENIYEAVNNRLRDAIIDAVLESAAMRGLFTALGDAIGEAVNDGIVSAVEFGAIQLIAGQIQAQLTPTFQLLDELGLITRRQTDAVRDNTRATEDLTRELRNVPSGFRVDAAWFNALTPQNLPPNFNATAPLASAQTGDTFSFTFEGDVVDRDRLQEDVQDAVERAQRVKDSRKFGG